MEEGCRPHCSRFAEDLEARTAFSVCEECGAKGFHNSGCKFLNRVDGKCIYCGKSSCFGKCIPF